MQSFFLDNSHFDLLIVTGEDAEKFLQGQLTCDVASLSIGDFCYGAACNNKGRIIAPFLLVKLQSQYQLVFAQGLGTAFRDNLKKFLPFYKCSMLLNESPQLVMGLAGNVVAELLATNDISQFSETSISQFDSGWLISLGNTLEQFICCYEALPSWCDLASLNADSGSLWQWCLLQNAHFPFSKEDIEGFTPQELGLDRKDYVSFTKGCYTGQEIVARMHYRGKAKKQLYLLSIKQEFPEDLQDIDVLDAQGKELAKGLKVTSGPDNMLSFLVILPLEFAQTQASLATKAGNLITLQVF